MEDWIFGSLGLVIWIYGEMVVIWGGLYLNGYNVWLGVGDFFGGCISGMMVLVFS